MIKSLTAFFDEHVNIFAGESAGETHSLELAVAALLLEIVVADHEELEAERGAVTAAIRDAFDLNDEEIQDLLAAADEAVGDAVSLNDFTDVINEKFDADHKFVLMERLWKVACADDRLDKYEEYTIRKIADLLHVPHRKFIQAKHNATGG